MNQGWGEALTLDLPTRPEEALGTGPVTAEFQPRVRKIWLRKAVGKIKYGGTGRGQGEKF